MFEFKGTQFYPRGGWLKMILLYLPSIILQLIFLFESLEPHKLLRWREISADVIKLFWWCLNKLECLTLTNIFTLVYSSQLGLLGLYKECGQVRGSIRVSKDNNTRVKHSDLFYAKVGTVKGLRHRSKSCYHADAQAFSSHSKQSEKEVFVSRAWVYQWPVK